jgi:hypothetical protein
MKLTDSYRHRWNGPVDKYEYSFIRFEMTSFSDGIHELSDGDIGRCEIATLFEVDLTVWSRFNYDRDSVRIEFVNSIIYRFLLIHCESFSLHVTILCC